MKIRRSLDRWGLAFLFCFIVVPTSFSMTRLIMIHKQSYSRGQKNLIILKPYVLKIDQDSLSWGESKAFQINWPLLHIPSEYKNGESNSPSLYIEVWIMLQSRLKSISKIHLLKPLGLLVLCSASPHPLHLSLFRLKTHPSWVTKCNTEEISLSLHGNDFTLLRK